MIWQVFADAVVLLHLSVVAFIVFGGFLALRWPRVALVHLPFAAWGVAIEVWQWVCPLTPLENHLRQRGGGRGYSGGFVEHYVLPVLYPEKLTERTGLVLASLLLAVNVVAYAGVYRRVHRSSSKASRAPS